MFRHFKGNTTSNKLNMNTTIDHDSSIPLHQQAETFLRKLIEEEEYQQGKLLPNEVVMSEQMKISRNTLRQAINKLVFEGLLIRKKGYGTIVNKRKVLSGAKNWLSFSQEMKAMGILVKNFEMHVSFKKPAAEACIFFESSPNERVLTLERLRGKSEFPFVYFISYFNPAVGLTGNEDFNRPLYDIIELEKGFQVKSSREELSAMIATPFLAEKLEINIGDPILVRKRFVLDVNEFPIEYNLGYYRADSFTYSIECIRE